MSSAVLQQLAKLKVGNLAVFVLVGLFDELLHVSLGAQSGTQLLSVDKAIAVFVLRMQHEHAIREMSLAATIHVIQRTQTHQVGKRKLLEVVCLGNVGPHRGGALGGMIIQVTALNTHVAAWVERLAPDIVDRAWGASAFQRRLASVVSAVHGVACHLLRC